MIRNRYEFTEERTRFPSAPVRALVSPFSILIVVPPVVSSHTIRISSPLSFLPFNLMLSSRLYSGKVRAVLVPSVSRPTSLIFLSLLLSSFRRFLLLFSSPFFSFVLLLLRSARQRCRWLSRYLSR